MRSKFLLFLKYFVLFAIFLVFKMIFSSNFYSKKEKFIPKFPIPRKFQAFEYSRCYRLPIIERPIDYFEDILDAPKQPKSGKTVFFHETTCSTTGVVSLNAK